MQLHTARDAQSLIPCPNPNPNNSPPQIWRPPHTHYCWLSLSLWTTTTARGGVPSPPSTRRPLESPLLESWPGAAVEETPQAPPRSPKLRLEAGEKRRRAREPGFAWKMPLLEKQENGEQVLVKNEAYLQILKNKDQRKRLVHEICTFLDSSQSVQEIDALRTENRKLKNANSRLRYKTKDWALKKEEYENEIERLSGEISNYLNVTNFWYEESELLNSQDKRMLSEPRKHVSTQTERTFGLEKRTVETQTGDDSSRYQTLHC
ncbi:uncharacterized protein LOC128337714 isoform X3 [Hemicordylus capensis]|uniref:uncharacterized protein LOC128337714 isoform X3 n=1 Tax=Hemicordylus capensis TaxID=884348 RepID=UPI00230308BC|nr:uncharacterized protein LOC128337714 isoform X3 [Hemicordylus capensis]